MTPKKETPIVVAVSGGPDSMALLSMLQKQYDTIVVAHVNHNTGRPGQKEEEIFVKNYCEKHNLIFESMIIQKHSKKNFHNEAHKIRYQFFEEILKKYHTNYLFTAHHGDDLIETILFRIMRGSSIKAIHGPTKKSQKNGYTIIRPLLTYTKQQLLEYNKKNNIPYCIDSSNEKDIYTRNRIRKQILPFLKKENKNVHLKFLKFSEELNEIEEYLQKQTEQQIKTRLHQNELSLKNWDQLDTIIQKRTLEYTLGHIYSERTNLESKHIHMLQALIKKRSGTTLHFPNNIKIRKEYDTLRIIQQEINHTYELELKENLLLPNGHNIKFEETELDSNFVCRLNKQDLTFPLIVRTKKPGDKIKVKGLNHNKKVKEIMINEKIPLHLRNSYPIVTDSQGNIIWIPGIKKSQFCKTKEEKYDIILKYY